MVAEVLAVVAGLLGGGEAPHVCRHPVVTSRLATEGVTVTPTQCGRELALTRPGVVVRAAGGYPSETMRDQLRCHAYFASFQRDWHLEYARPVVAWPRMILSGCNPS